MSSEILRELARKNKLLNQQIQEGSIDVTQEFLTKERMKTIAAEQRFEVQDPEDGKDTVRKLSLKNRKLNQG